MNKRIRELAEQAGAKYYVHADYLLTTDLDVEQFAALIRQDENEACAKVCDKFGEEWNRTIITDDISEAIRERMK